MKSTYQLFGIYLDNKPIPETRPIILNSSNPNLTIDISYLLSFDSENELLSNISTYLKYNSLFLNIEKDYLFNPIVAKLYIKKALQIYKIISDLKNKDFVNFIFKGDINFVNNFLNAFYPYI